MGLIDVFKKKERLPEPGTVGFHFQSGNVSEERKAQIREAARKQQVYLKAFEKERKKKEQSQAVTRAKRELYPKSLSERFLGPMVPAREKRPMVRKNVKRFIGVSNQFLSPSVRYNPKRRGRYF